MKWILAMCVSFMGIAFAHPEKEQPILYYSDDCDINILPDAGPAVRGDWNAFLTADFIYWTVRQDGMAYAVSGAGTNVSGRVHGMEWTWDPGFKVGLGVNLPHDGWSLFAQYTWIQTSISDTTSQAVPEATPGNPAPITSLIPYWMTNGSTPVLTKATAAWNVHYNNLTLDLGRNAYMSQYMKLRLFAGLHAAWIDQDYKVNYTPQTGDHRRLDLSQDFWGIGLRTGMDNTFQFTKCFSFFADLALSLLWGEFDLSRKETSINPATGDSHTVLNTGASPHTAEPVVNVAAGLRYDTWFSEDRFHFALQAGWEHSLWILHNEVIKNLNEPDHSGDLYLQGLTIKARFDF